MTYLEPFTLLFLLAAGAGLFGLRRHWRTWAWKVACAGVLLLAALSWAPASIILGSPLTARYSRDPRPDGDADAIVVLAGGVSGPTRRRPYSIMGRDTYRRVKHAAWLYHNWKPLPVLATGGVTSPGVVAAAEMRVMLQQEGVPGAMIWTEETSRSTYENALLSAPILRSHGVRRIALVVEADGMLRAELCFRKQGLLVTPAPCVFRDFEFTGDALLPGWQGIYRQEELAHEMGGLVWYWLKGRI